MLKVIKRVLRKGQRKMLEVINGVLGQRSEENVGGHSWDQGVWRSKVTMKT